MTNFLFFKIFLREKEREGGRKESKKDGRERKKIIVKLRVNKRDIDSMHIRVFLAHFLNMDFQKIILFLEHKEREGERGLGRG